MDDSPNTTATHASVVGSHACTPNGSFRINSDTPTEQASPIATPPSVNHPAVALPGYIQSCAVLRLSSLPRARPHSCYRAQEWCKGSDIGVPLRSHRNVCASACFIVLGDLYARALEPLYRRNVSTSPRFLDSSIGLLAGIRRASGQTRALQTRQQKQGRIPQSRCAKAPPTRRARMQN